MASTPPLVTAADLRASAVRLARHRHYLLARIAEAANAGDVAGIEEAMEVLRLAVVNEEWVAEQLRNLTQEGVR
jgi:hypothetical protein